MDNIYNIDYIDRPDIKKVFISSEISILMDTHEMGSAMIVVEDNSEQSIGQHSKKDDDRQDPSL